MLDVGCAKGFLVKVFRDQGIEAWGVDVSEYAISSAPDDVRPYLRQVDLNKDALPFGDGYFDFVTFLATIEYLADSSLTIEQVDRVLKPGGGLYLTTIFGTNKSDKLRINVHDKGHWVREFQSSGLILNPQMGAPQVPPVREPSRDKGHIGTMCQSVTVENATRIPLGP